MPCFGKIRCNLQLLWHVFHLDSFSLFSKWKKRSSSHLWCWQWYCIIYNPDTSPVVFQLCSVSVLAPLREAATAARTLAASTQVSGCCHKLVDSPSQQQLMPALNLLIFTSAKHKHSSRKHKHMFANYISIVHQAFASFVVHLLHVLCHWATALCGRSVDVQFFSRSISLFLLLSDGYQPFVKPQRAGKPGW